MRARRLDPGVATRWQGIRIAVGRGYYGPTVNLLGAGRVSLTEHERGWMSEPHKLKPRQFGKLELDRRYLHKDVLPAGAPAAFVGTKSRFDRHGFSNVLAVAGVFVGGAFQRQGYGLAMYLMALKIAASRGLWLVNDTKRSTSTEAQRTWRALFRYAARSIEGPPLPQELFDYKHQRMAVGYRHHGLTSREDTVVATHRPVFGAFGLSGEG